MFNNSLIENDVCRATRACTSTDGGGQIAVEVPKIRNRSGSDIKFNSNIVRPYIRESQHVSTALLWLYLKGMSTKDMRESLRVLLGGSGSAPGRNTYGRSLSRETTVDSRP